MLETFFLFLMFSFILRLGLIRTSERLLFHRSMSARRAGEIMVSRMTFGTQPIVGARIVRTTRARREAMQCGERGKWETEKKRKAEPQKGQSKDTGKEGEEGKWNREDHTEKWYGPEQGKEKEKEEKTWANWNKNEQRYTQDEGSDREEVQG